jgi:uncharacterized protein
VPRPRIIASRLLLICAVVLAACGSTDSASSSGSRAGTLDSSVKKASEDLKILEGGLPHATAKLPTPSTASNVEREYLTAVADDIQQVWRREFRASHLTYRTARVVLFWSKVKSDCGTAEDSGPFYCPADRTVYLDVKFFTDLLRAAGPGSAAQAYIVGHEFGHHVQQLVGIAASVADANEANPGGANARSVKAELQADCLAGVWGKSAFPRTELTITDLNQALRAAQVIGDDYLQEAAGQVVDSKEWTHGSSKQRQYWVRRGYETGQPSSCDTFASG